MNRSGDLLLFHIRVIREAGTLTLVFRKNTELERGVGRSLPYNPVGPLRSCDRGVLIHCDVYVTSLAQNRGPVISRKTALHIPLNAEIVLPTEKSSSLYLPHMDPETYSGLKMTPLSQIMVPTTGGLMGTSGESSGKKGLSLCS